MLLPFLHLVGFIVVVFLLVNVPIILSLSKLGFRPSICSTTSRVESRRGRRERKEPEEKAEELALVVVTAVAAPC